MIPEDVDPESRCRLPLPRREELDEATRTVYDRLATPGAGNLRGLRGPGGIQLHSPELSRRSRPVNHYLRFESGLSGRVRELAILVTARAHDSQFEWAAHEAEALREGVPEAAIEAVRRRRGVDGLAEEDAIVISLGREMFVDRRVSPATFAQSLKIFGHAGLVNLVALMGNYAATAALLTAFDMQLDDGVEPPLPLP
ncbi:MAG TPA: carboxymuconolactone decarboxylase family protein [Stellaceae bacterium]|jgi:4-carboxymuconolactone decarboxylase|nr:carboxymuconolactone decarboxylase family protein [Stellaceae bacterium]